MPTSEADPLRAVSWVASARRFVSHTVQREHRGKPLRIVVQGLSWPDDHGDWIPLVGGRALRQAHYEMVADRSLGLELGENVRLGKDVYEVVGLTSGMVGSSGDGLGFFTVSDAQAIQFDLPGAQSPACGHGLWVAPPTWSSSSPVGPVPPATSAAFFCSVLSCRVAE